MPRSPDRRRMRANRRVAPNVVALSSTCRTHQQLRTWGSEIRIFPGVPEISRIWAHPRRSKPKIRTAVRTVKFLRASPTIALGVCRLVESERSQVHNRLVGRSSPPGSTTQSAKCEEFLKTRELPRIGAVLCWDVMLTVDRLAILFGTRSEQMRGMINQNAARVAAFAGLLDA